jgi:glycosyltransferase involved in cell wall biosynthesis
VAWERRSAGERKSQTMRIAQIATLATPVRRAGSGSIEGHVWLLGRELSRMGHEVTTFASAGSDVHGDLVTTLRGPYGSAGVPADWHVCEWINICRALEDADCFDVIHSHAYLWALPLQACSRARLVHTLHVMPTEDDVCLRATAPHAPVVGISQYQWSDFPDLQPRTIIAHGVDDDQFTFRPDPDDYVCYLGRFTPDKGPLHAIMAAKAAGVQLRLAGPKNDYFRTHIQPRVDGERVQYVGPVAGRTRDELLGGARALLYPVVNPEPFGLVVAEAMYCGTPVVATNVGAIPELVQNGVTGQTVNDLRELPQGIVAVSSLDRRAIREEAERRFSASVMAARYADFYERVVQQDGRGEGTAAAVDTRP